MKATTWILSSHYLHNAADGFLLIIMWVRSKLILGMPVLQCRHSHNIHNEHIHPSEKENLNIKKKKNAGKIELFLKTIVACTKKAAFS